MLTLSSVKGFLSSTQVFVLLITVGFINRTLSFYKIRLII